MSSSRFEKREWNVIMQIMLLLSLLGKASVTNAEIETLFTTPQERQLINANRYKTEKIIKPRVEDTRTEFVAPTAQEEVNISFVISGITISGSGPHSVWINNMVYEDGEHLEDNSHIKVLTGDMVRVRITTPDGQIYYGTSGEVVDVNYMAVVEN
jgi:hypothetical protein